MKPNFALNITDDEIELLQRQAKGWQPVGSVRFDNPDLDEAVSYLRGTALSLSPEGMTTKLVLPRSQVLYLTLEAPGPSEEERRAQIAEALSGRTPYAVEELIFDWALSDEDARQVTVAAVARETLQEAEAFAVNYRLNPLCFATLPTEGAFKVEPFFGPADLAQTLLPSGVSVTPDRKPMVILSAQLPTEPPSAELAPEPAPEAQTPPEPEADLEEKAQLDAERLAAEQEAEREALARLEAERIAAERAEADRLRAEAAEREAMERAEAEAARRTAEAQRLAREAAERIARETAAREAAAAEAEAARAQLQAARLEAEQASAKQAAPPEESAENIEAPLPSFSSRRAAHGTQGKAPALGAALPSDEASTTAPRLGLNLASSPQAPSAPRDLPASNAPDLTEAVRRAADASLESTTANPSQKSNATKSLTQLSSNASAVAGKLGGFFSQAREQVSGLSAQLKRRPVKPQQELVERAHAPEDEPSALAPHSQPEATPEHSTISAPAPQESSYSAPPAFLAHSPRAPAKTDTDIAAQQDDSDTLVMEAPRKPVTAAPPVPTKARAVQKTAPASTSRRPAALLTSKASNTAKTTAARSPLASKAKSLPPHLNAASPEPDKTGLGSFAQRLQRPAGKPRYLGLILTVLLLAVLAGIATWSSLYLSRDNSAISETEFAALPPSEDIVDENATSPDSSVSVAETDLTAPPEPEDDSRALIQSAEVAAAPPTPPLDTLAPQASELAEHRDEIILAAPDGPPPSFDAAALPAPSDTTSLPSDVTEPPPFGTQYQFDAQGQILATPKAVITPDGVRLIEARPSKIPPTRPQSATETAAALDPASTAGALPAAQPLSPELAPTAPTETTTAENTEAFSAAPESPRRRPVSRPRDFTPAESATDAAAAEADTTASQTATLDPAAQDPQLLGARPRNRPASVTARAEEAQRAATEASLAANAAAAAAVEVAAAEPSASWPVVRSIRPSARPANFNRAVSAAAAAATRPKAAAAAQSDPEELEDEPEPVRASAAPRIPTTASVAKQATYTNAINLSKINLIGVYGSQNNRYALVRSSNGRYSKVKVGDRLDGGTVAAITSNELRYRKGNRMVSLEMPRG